MPSSCAHLVTEGVGASAAATGIGSACKAAHELLIFLAYCWLEACSALYTARVRPCPQRAELNCNIEMHSWLAIGSTLRVCRDMKGWRAIALFCCVTSTAERSLQGLQALLDGARKGCRSALACACTMQSVAGQLVLVCKLLPLAPGWSTHPTFDRHGCRRHTKPETHTLYSLHF